MKKIKDTVETVFAVVFFVAIVVGVIFMASKIVEVYSPYDFDDCEHIEYYVEEGDNLYSICKRVCGERVDYRDWVKYVKEINGKNNSTIYVGEIITIPVM